MPGEGVVCFSGHKGEVRGGTVLRTIAARRDNESLEWVCDIDSHARGKDCTPRLKLVFSVVIPRWLVRTPPGAKKAGRHQNNLKLSIKPKLNYLHAESSQVWR